MKQYVSLQVALAGDVSLSGPAVGHLLRLAAGSSLQTPAKLHNSSSEAWVLPLTFRGTENWKQGSLCCEQLTSVLGELRKYKAADKMKSRSQWVLKSWELLLPPHKHRMVCLYGGKSRVMIWSWKKCYLYWYTDAGVSLQVAFPPALYKPVMLYRHMSWETDYTCHYPKKMVQWVGIFVQDVLRKARTQ